MEQKFHPFSCRYLLSSFLGDETFFNFLHLVWHFARTLGPICLSISPYLSNVRKSFVTFKNESDVAKKCFWQTKVVFLIREIGQRLKMALAYLIGNRRSLTSYNLYRFPCLSSAVWSAPFYLPYTYFIRYLFIGVHKVFLYSIVCEFRLQCLIAHNRSTIHGNLWKMTTVNKTLCLALHDLWAWAYKITSFWGLLQIPNKTIMRRLCKVSS